MQKYISPNLEPRAEIQNEGMKTARRFPRTLSEEDVEIGDVVAMWRVGFGSNDPKSGIELPALLKIVDIIPAETVPTGVQIHGDKAYVMHTPERTVYYFDEHDFAWLYHPQDVMQWLNIAMWDVCEQANHAIDRRKNKIDLLRGILVEGVSKRPMGGKQWAVGGGR